MEQLPAAAARLPTELTSVVGTAIVAFAALVIFTGAIGSLRAGRQAGRLLATQLGVGLEFLLAAGLIRLASVESVETLVLAVAVIATRRTIVLGLGYAARATG